MPRGFLCAAFAAAMILFSPSANAAAIRTEAKAPEKTHITVADLPEPYASDSARKSPKVVDPPEDAVLHAPEGFTVSVFAEIPSARWLTLTPKNEVLCCSSNTNTIYLLPDRDGDGKADDKLKFATKDNGLNLPMGMAFADGHFFVGNTDAVRRWEYKAGQDALSGEGRLVTELPGKGYNQHWTRNVIVAPDGESLFVSVGSESNVSVEAPPRAAIIRVGLDGTERHLYASGLRNPVGLALHPKTKALYTAVNERDRLGDDLVPDYFTQVEEGAFYGWPYAYLSPKNIDPRRADEGRSERPDLVERTKTPDVLFQAHSAALGVDFYAPPEDAARPFPKRYRGGAFVAFRGSWNRSEGTGYKIVFVPFDSDNRPEGGYEDFVTGFLLKPEVPQVWGRPVDVQVMPDGSLLFTEEANGRIYRVTYDGKSE